MSLKTWIPLAIGLLFLSACGGKEPDPIPEPEATEYKVAMIFPQGEWNCIKPVVEWAMEQVPKGIALKLEWIDENGANMAKEASRVTHDNSYAAVIGPEYSNSARVVARESLSYRIPVLMPMVTSTEFQRIYAETNKNEPNIFCLAQSDMAQCEAVIAKAKQNGLQTLLMICRSGEIDDYSASFEQYFMFMAREAGLKQFGYATYESEEHLTQLMTSIMELLPDFEAPGLFFVPSSTADMLAFDRIMGAYKSLNGLWPILCADIANEPSLAGKLTSGPYEGFSLGATEAFESSWTGRMGSDLPGGYAQLYDAVALVAEACQKVESGSAKTVREALEGLVFAREYSGVSGKIHFNEDAPIAPVETIYRNWYFHDGKYSRLGSAPHHLEKGWDWSAAHIDEYEDVTEDSKWYDPLQNHFAFIVATSTGWNNYRHQADALAMYQMLKGFGYTDNQIILVMEDDIANNPSNPYKGEVRVTPDGENLRAGAEVDYKLSALTPEDLKNIFSGVPTEKTPVVIQGGSGTNVLVFWSGHGAKDYELKWGSGIIKDEQFEEILEGSERNYRKMFIVMDTCYSGSIAEQCWGHRGLLYLCSASRGEPSHADVYDEKCGTYLSNGFTRAFRSAVEANPNITLNNLYKEVARETTGSHAGVYNFYYYGSLYSNTFAEYLNR